MGNGRSARRGTAGGELAAKIRARQIRKFQGEGLPPFAARKATRPWGEIVGRMGAAVRKTGARVVQGPEGPRVVVPAERPKGEEG